LPILLKPEGALFVTCNKSFLTNEVYNGFESESDVAEYLGGIIDRLLLEKNFRCFVCLNLDGYPETQYRRIEGLIIARMKKDKNYNLFI